MLIEKEVIAPGTYWYTDEKTGVPRKLDVSADMTKWWHQQGSKMLGHGLPIPVPYEHDFDQHPMTAKDKLLNNAGGVKEYRLKSFTDPIRGEVKDALFSVVEVTDPKVEEKINNGSIKWTSPWINSFTDGDGRKWNNVISHLALTTRPRITRQLPFGSVAAALSMASPTTLRTDQPNDGLCLSRAGLLLKGRPAYPVAFSLFSGAAALGNENHDESGKFAKGGGGKKSKAHQEHEEAESKHAHVGHYLAKVGKGFLKGAGYGAIAGTVVGGPVGGVIGGAAGAAIGTGRALSVEDGGTPISAAFGEFPPPKKGKPNKPESQGGKPDANPTPDEDIDVGGDAGGEGGNGNEPGPDGIPGTGDDNGVDLPPLGDKAGDVSMEEVLCDLLRALGVDCQHDGDEAQFKRNLYAAAMKKVHDLTSKGMNKEEDPKPGSINAGKPPGSPGAQPNPLVQQEQQPMYMGLSMTLEEIQKLTEPARTVALSMYAENQKLTARLEANEKTTNSLRDSKLKEAAAHRTARVTLLGKVSPKAKADLEVMLTNPSFALSMGEAGEVIDPMSQTLKILEAGLSDIPTLLRVDSAALATQPHPKDGDELSAEEVDKIADGYARRMGAEPLPKSA